MNSTSLMITEQLKELLEDFDRQTDARLEEPYKQIEYKSKALANSLRRCFRQARSSERFLAAYQLGLADRIAFAEHTRSPKEVSDRLAAEFAECDFMFFREFVRLLRACSLHIGGGVSAQIKAAYKSTLQTDRVYLAYRFGLEENS